MTKEEFEERVYGICVVVMMGAKQELNELFEDEICSQIIEQHMGRLIWNGNIQYEDTDTGFGFSLDNPIHTCRISQNKFYIKKLHEAKKSIIATHRYGCYRSPISGHLVDRYLVCYISGKDKISFKIIYIDPYCEEMSDKFPEGF